MKLAFQKPFFGSVCEFEGGAGLGRAAVSSEAEAPPRAAAAKVTYVTGREGEPLREGLREGEPRREEAYRQPVEEPEEHHRKGLMGKVSEAAHKVGAKLRGEE